MARNRNFAYVSKTYKIRKIVGVIITVVVKENDGTGRGRRGLETNKTKRAALSSDIR